MEYPWQEAPFAVQISSARIRIIREWKRWAEAVQYQAKQPDSPWRLHKVPYPAPPLPVGPYKRFLLPTWWKGFRAASRDVVQKWSKDRHWSYYVKGRSTIARRAVLMTAKWSTKQLGGSGQAIYLKPRPTWTKRSVAGTPSQSRMRFARLVRRARGNR